MTSSYSQQQKSNKPKQPNHAARRHNDISQKIATHAPSKQATLPYPTVPYPTFPSPPLPYLSLPSLPSPPLPYPEVSLTGLSAPQLLARAGQLVLEPGVLGVAVLMSEGWEVMGLGEVRVSSLLMVVIKEEVMG